MAAADIQAQIAVLEAKLVSTTASMSFKERSRTEKSNAEIIKAIDYLTGKLAAAEGSGGIRTVQVFYDDENEG